MHLESEPTMSSFAIKLFRETLEFNAVAPKAINRAHHFDKGPAKSIELPDDENVVRPKVGKAGIELLTSRASTSRLFPFEQLGAACQRQCVALEIQVLVYCRDACVPNQHVKIVTQDHYQENRNAGIFSGRSFAICGCSPGGLFPCTQNGRFLDIISVCARDLAEGRGLPSNLLHTAQQEAASTRLE
jgi:hypothetical protein